MTLYKLVFILLLFSAGVKAQDAKQLHESAKAFMKKGDFPNAIIVLNKAIEQEPSDNSLSKDLALSYYFINDNKKALEVIAPLLGRDDADDQTYQIAGNVYKNLKQLKEAEKIYKEGLKKFQTSGALYNDLGEMLWNQKDYSAIKIWEKGIENDPSYSKNYYNAARYYFLSTDKIWSIIYGEIFLNMEPFSSKSPEVKDLLLESYKKLFMEVNDEKNKDNGRFENAFFQVMNKQAAVASFGITPETLTMIRTRFILDWFNEGKRPSFKLFDYQRQLLQEGMFDAYNQWLFGSAQNLSSFQNWINTHTDEYASFTEFQKNRVFRLPEGEYYAK